MHSNIKTYRYSLGRKFIKLVVVIALIAIVMGLLSIEYFRTLPLLVVPILVGFVAAYKYLNLKKILSLCYIIDLNEETLKCGKKSYDLKTMTTLNIKNVRGVEKFSIIYAKSGKETKLVIDGKFPDYIALRNEIIEIGKKYDPNVYSLLKRQSM